MLDASVFLAIAFDEDHVPSIDPVLEALDSRKAIVPAIWPAEVANALIVGERKKRITDEEIRWVLQRLKALPVEMDVEGTVAALDRALPIARALKLSAHDALYIELAQRRGLPLATLDRQLAEAAAKSSIELMLG